MLWMNVMHFTLKLRWFNSWYRKGESTEFINDRKVCRKKSLYRLLQLWNWERIICKDGLFLSSTHKTRRPNRLTVQQVGPAWQGLRAQFRQLIPDCHRHSTIPRENSHSLFHLNEKTGNGMWTVVGKLKYMLCTRFKGGSRGGVNTIKW